MSDQNIKAFDHIEVYKEAKRYWQEQFSDETVIEEFFPYNEQNAGKQQNYAFLLDKEMTSALLERTGNQPLVFYSFCMSAMMILLHLFSGRGKVYISSPIYDLSREIETGNEMIVLKTSFQDSMSIRNCLNDVHQTVLQGYRNQHYPLENLFEKESNLHKILLSYSEIHEECGSNTDFHLRIVKKADTMKCILYYNGGVYPDKIAKNLCDKWKMILGQMLHDMDHKVNEIDILLPEERELLNKVNHTKEQYGEETVIELFEKQVKNNPDNIALAEGDRTVTYLQLNQRANQIARFLRRHGVKSQDVVGLMLPRSIEFMEGILGILKTGAAYVPIDIQYPTERKQYIIDDCHVSQLLCAEGMKDQEQFDCNCWELTDHLGEDEEGMLSDKIYPQDLAYVIYTSGSTGKPKGVMIEHAGLSNYIFWAWKEYGDFSKVNMPLYSQVSFDLTVTSVYVPLVSGGTVFIYGDETVKSMNRLVTDNMVDIVKLTPSHLRIMQEMKIPQNTSIKCLIVGGEKLERDIAEKITHQFGGKIRIMNEYGPTEATVGCMIHEYSPKEDTPQVSIGKPIDNMQIYVMNPFGKECSQYSVGEIYIGGIGVARGYFGNESLTEERFVQKDGESKLYKTGDLARWCEDGNLEYIGRIDDQVKVNGYRIELDEIKENLQKHKDIREAVVLVKTDHDSDKHYLCAYIVADLKIADDELIAYLRQTLPNYMIPAKYIYMDRLPLTSNGKLDKKALPEPQQIKTVSEYKKPENAIEEELVEMWEKILGKSNIGTTDRFLELGGDSISILRMQAMLQRRFHVDIALSSFFEDMTVLKMKELISSMQKSIYTEIRKIEHQEEYEASYAQKRLYTLQKTGRIGTSYNIPMFFEIIGEFDIHRMEAAIQIIIDRHEIFRTAFRVSGSKIVQVIEDKIEFRLPYIQDKNNEFVPEDWVEEFELWRAPLIRAKVIETSEQKRYFMIDMHHIISDGITMELFIGELRQLYAGIELPEVEYQYKDYAEWQNRVYANSQEQKIHEEFWKKQFEKKVPPLELASDYKRPEKRSYRGANYEFKLDKQLTREINQMAKQQECTPFMVLLSAYLIMLSKYSGEEDITVGTPVMGRTCMEFETIMGMFVNTLVLRNQVNGAMSYLEFLEGVKDVAIHAFEHQDYQFNELVDMLQIRTEADRNPLFDVMFVLQNPDEQAIEGDLQLRLLCAKNNISKFDLTLTAYEEGKEYYFNFEYNVDLFESDTIKRFSESMLIILEKIVSIPSQRVADICVISKNDMEMLQQVNETDCNITAKTVIELFERQVAATPTTIAIEENDVAITYEELNNRVNQTVEYLKEQHIGMNDVVAIMLERSQDYMIGMLASMKLGAAYVPIEVDYPSERKSFILQDSGAKCVISRKRYLENVIYSGMCVEPLEHWKNTLIANPEAIGTPENLAYIIYTSGSTGKPKGVMIRQSNLVNYLLWARKMYADERGGDMPFYSRTAFDLTVTSLYVPLISGSKVVVYGEEYGQFALKKVIAENKVNIIKLTPAHLKMLKEWKLPDECKIHTFIVGGESLESRLAGEISHKFAENVKIYNEYGPTEATVGCMIYQYSPNDTSAQVSIGRPADNIQIYVLDQYMKQVPVNVPGEMYIGGKSVAKGYINRKEMTKLHFISDSFKETGIIYKTGDMARWKKDGNLEFLGRKDFQVKIRGFRIELEEVKNCILSLDAIKDAFVIDKEDDTRNRYLCAYIVKREDISMETLRLELKKQLPDYMIPSAFVFLDEIPLSDNGKIDRKKLPESQTIKETQKTSIQPQTHIEKVLWNIWKRTLNIEDFGIEDSFFDIGGDSIKAVFIEIEAEKEGIYHGDTLSTQIYETPTIRELALFIEKSK